MSLGSKPKELLAHLFREYHKGNRTAIGKLVECFYPELRHLAAMRMRNERAGHMAADDSGAAVCATANAALRRRAATEAF
jgi:ECF sigma factor